MYLCWTLAKAKRTAFQSSPSFNFVEDSSAVGVSRPPHQTVRGHGVPISTV